MKPLTAADKRLPELVAAYRESRNIGKAAKQAKMAYAKAAQLLQQAGECFPVAGVWTKRIPIIRKMLAEGAENIEIASRLNLSQASVHDAIKRFFPDHSRSANDVPIPKAFRIVGEIADDPADLSARVVRCVNSIGAVVLICQGGRFAAALPGTRAARQAERAQPCAIVGTYFFAPASRGGYRVEAATRELIEGDIREAMR